MSKDLSPDQMKAMAKALSDMGRRGDTQLVHVTKEEVELLKKIGSGTRNPETGLLEFAPTNQSWVDQWNASVGEEHKIDTSNSNPNISGTNTDGTTYDSDPNKGDDDFTNNYTSILTVDPATGKTVGVSEAANGGEAGISGRGVISDAQREANRKANPFDRDGDGSMWTETDRFGATTNIFGQQMNITANNNSGYIWNALDADGDGSFLTANNNSYGTNALVKGNSTFSTVANVAALVTNPVAYLGAKAINSYFDKDGDGSMFTSGGVFNNPLTGGGDATGTAKPITTGGGGSSSSSSSNSSSETESSAEGADDVTTDEASTYSDVVGDFAYNQNKFSRRADGMRFLNYNYSGGVADVAGSYTDTVKPFQIIHSMEDAKAFAFSEEAANQIDQMMSMMPREVSDSLEGSIHTYMTKDGNIAVIVGTDDTGYVEATYAGSQDGAKNAMNDIANMLAYMEATGDTKVDGGFMGRMASAERFAGYGLSDLQAILSRINEELELYEVGSSSYRMAMERKQEVEREIARRQGDASAQTTQYSEAGVATVVGETAASLVNS